MKLVDNHPDVVYLYTFIFLPLSNTVAQPKFLNNHPSAAQYTCNFIFIKFLEKQRGILCHSIKNIIGKGSGKYISLGI
jgi:hypothetical protein